MNTGTAKEFKTITEDRIVIDHTPTKFVKIYVNDRQTGDAMNEEAKKIVERILFLEEYYKEHESKTGTNQ